MHQESNAQRSRRRKKLANRFCPPSSLQTSHHSSGGWNCARREGEKRWSERPGWAADSVRNAPLKASISWVKKMVLEMVPAPRHPEDNSAASPAQSKRERRAIHSLRLHQLLCRRCSQNPWFPATCTMLGHIWHPASSFHHSCFWHPLACETCVLCILPAEAYSKPHHILHRRVQAVCRMSLHAALPTVLKG